MRRERTYSDPRVIEFISRNFVPAAVNINTLQRQDDEEGRFFRSISWQGRFGLSYEEAKARSGDTEHRECHQGQYVATIEGELLGSKHTADPDVLLEMMEGGLAKWPERKTQRHVTTLDGVKRDGKYAWTYPEDGLVLNLGCRDLARDEGVDAEWDFDAHNQDYIWLTRQEMLSLVPDAPIMGMRFDVPKSVKRRLVRYHLLDIVRGETPPWPKEAPDDVAMDLEVTGVTDDVLEMRLSGAGRLVENGDWCAQPPKGAPYRRGQMCCMINERGFEPEILGYLAFDRKQQRFTRFDAVIAGIRWGGTTFNFRQRDVEPAPLGIAITIAGTDPRDRTPPHGSRPETYFSA